ncbi:low molecular weight protein arginine phosphatase [Bacillus sp. 165]|uniref:low molecular weight protein arginine phosphatase n=1 Tax=Bacillus sp. 165 TaxID=1529117 RepID=UPI001ADC3C0E|nr:low molecular weight protein arginine phosphatase [Bacillus sp. 165]
MKRILFVCTGNTCRSPMAEAALRHYGKEAFEVQSAGVFASAGSNASSHAIRALEERGISINHQSQQVTEELISWADAVLTMTANHKAAILYHFPDMQEKVHTLYEFVETDFKDISDPFGGSLQVYQETLHELERLIHQMIQKENDGV